MVRCHKKVLLLTLFSMKWLFTAVFSKFFTINYVQFLRLSVDTPVLVVKLLRLCFVIFKYSLVRGFVCWKSNWTEESDYDNGFETPLFRQFMQQKQVKKWYCRWDFVRLVLSTTWTGCSVIWCYLTNINA